MRAYLHATGRSGVADSADLAAKEKFLCADEGAKYSEVIEIVCDRTLFWPLLIIPPELIRA